MGMQFNIKDAETIRLAKVVAGKTGTSVTAAIRSALTREISRLFEAEQSDLQALENILRETRGRWKPEFDAVELSTAHGDLLYDDRGLPK